MAAILKCSNVQQRLISATKKVWTQKHLSLLPHPASFLLYFEKFWFGCWRSLDLEPVLTVLHCLLALLKQVIEGQYLRHEKKKNKLFFFLHTIKKEWRRAQAPTQHLSSFNKPFHGDAVREKENVTRPVVTSKLFVSIKILPFSCLMSTPKRRGLVQDAFHLTLRHL